jgi:4-hydroxybenzoyl-CoA reductase subunit gamma
MSGKRLISLTVNGRRRDDAVADHTLLVDYLRDQLGLTGTKTGCDGGECGACTVLVDGAPQLACITLAARCAGRKIETIEGLVQGGRMNRLQAAFHERLGTQCGFCTPGMIMAAEALLRKNPAPDETAIRDALSGNLCRCTGYVKIIESVQAASEPSFPRRVRADDAAAGVLSRGRESSDFDKTTLGPRRRGDDMA